jgi:hypothetical protein
VYEHGVLDFQSGINIPAGTKLFLRFKTCNPSITMAIHYQTCRRWVHKLRTRQHLINIAVFVIVTAVMLTGGEVLLRLFPSLVAISVIERMHPELRAKIATQLGLPTTSDYDVLSSAERTDHGPDIFLMKPNRPYFRPVNEVDKVAGAVDTITTDNRGFCNPPNVATAKLFDIVTVGGSVPNCVGVEGEKVFSSQLGDVLSMPSYNLTVNAVGPYEYNEVIKRYYEELTPKVVVFAIGEANDLRDCVRYLEFVTGKSGDRNIKLGGPFRVSFLLAFVRASIDVLYKDISAAFGPNFRYSVTVQGSTVKMNVTNGDLDELKSAKRLRDGIIQPDLYTVPLDKFVEFARQKRFAPLVLYIPATYTVYQKGIKFEDESITELMRNYSQAQRDWLEENAKRLGYEFFDPTKFLQERALTSPPLYFPSDMHPTPEGHKALAEAVAPTISNMLNQR